MKVLSGQITPEKFATMPTEVGHENIAQYELKELSMKFRQIQPLWTFCHANDAKHSSNCIEDFMVMTPILKLGQVWWKIQCVFLNIHSQKAFGVQSNIF